MAWSDSAEMAVVVRKTLRVTSDDDVRWVSSKIYNLGRVQYKRRVMLHTVNEGISKYLHISVFALFKKDSAKTHVHACTVPTAMFSKFHVLSISVLPSLLLIPLFRV